MRKRFKYRLYPNTLRQTRLLEQQLEERRWLYNHLLAARREAWEQRRESLRLDDQQATLPALKVARPTLAAVQSPVLQHVAVTPANTRQDCSQCGHRQPLALALAARIDTCPWGGGGGGVVVDLDRDYTASLNIVRLGQESLAAA